MLRGIRAVHLLLSPSSRQPLWWSLRQRVTRRRLVQEEISLRPLRRSVSEPLRNRWDAVEADAARVLALEEVRTPPPPPPTPHCAASVGCACCTRDAPGPQLCAHYRLQGWYRSSCRYATYRAARLSPSKCLPSLPHVSASCLGNWLCAGDSQNLYTPRNQCALMFSHAYTGRATRDGSRRRVRLSAVTRESPSQR